MKEHRRQHTRTGNVVVGIVERRMRIGQVTNYRLVPINSY